MKLVKNHKKGEEKEADLGQLLVSKFLPYWPLFILFIVLAMAGAYVKLRYTTPIYEAKATLIIKDEKKGNDDSKMAESLDLFSSKKIVENEIEVIQSRTLMDTVVRALFLYAPVSEQGKVKVSSAYMISPVIIQAQNPDSLLYAEKVKFSYDKVNKVVILNGNEKYRLNEFVKTPYGNIRFVPNKYYVPNTTQAKQLYFSIFDPKIVAMGLIGNLKAAASSKLSTVVDLSYKDEVPQRAEDVLNELIRAYEQSGILDRNALVRNTLSFVEDRLGLLSKDLNSIEQNVQQYKSGSNAVDIGTQGQLYLQNVSSNDLKLSEVNMQLSVLDQVEKFVVTRDNKQGIVPSTLGVTDPMLSGLLDKLYVSELDYEKLRKTVGENNPSLVAIGDQINKVRPDILQNIQSQKQSLNAAKNNLLNTNNKFNSILQSVPQKERQLLDISRDQAIKNNIYSFLLQKREESALSYASIVSNNRIVDYAKAGSEPVSPNKKMFYAIAIFMALAFCIVIITIKESFTSKVLYRKEIEALTSIPVIGEVAFTKTKTPIVVEAGKRSFIAEEFRKLRTSLSFLGIDSSRKKILVTSSISGEGKSFIASNLAVSMSLTGKKVVLVDLDLNVPSLSKVFGIQKDSGTTQFLTGEKSADEIINQVDGFDNLFFIPAGNLPDNPSELIVNGKVKELIEYLENRFDLVIVDTSPVVLVTDGYILSGLCDATLYVIKHNYTPKLLIKRIDENNQINELLNPAIVFNGVKERGFISNNYGYGYNYVYGKKVYGSDQNGKAKKKII
jgi:capsular exopolysaccharide synthesis family protein